MINGGGHVILAGVGPVCAAGAGMGALRGALETGARRLGRIEFGRGSASRSLPFYEAPVDDALDRFIPRRQLRRIDAFSRRALLAACLAVEDAGLSAVSGARVGIAHGSAWGPLQTTFEFHDSLLEGGPAGASPTVFSHSVHNAAASCISRHFHVTGPTLTLSQQGATLAGVLQAACRWLDEDRCDLVLAGVSEEFVPLFAYTLWRWRERAGDRDISAGDAWAEGDLRPDDEGRCSYVPGEASVFFLLTRASTGAPNAASLWPPTPAGLANSPDSGAPDLAISAAHGSIADSAACPLAPEGAMLARPAALYGSMPTGDGMALAVAAALLSEGRAPEWLTGGAGTQDRRIQRAQILTASAGEGAWRIRLEQD